jgi:O-antigen ligase
LTIAMSVFMAVAMNEFLFLGLPFVFLLGFQTIVDFKKIFWLLMICLPLSTEFDVSTSLATDLPTEPLMAGLSLVVLVYLAADFRRINYQVLKHPIIVILLLHFLWTLIAMVNSNLFWVSLKFVTAKIWYLLTFVVLTTMVIKTEKDFKTFFWCIYIPLLTTGIIILLRLAAMNFSFEDIQDAMKPFYRNHVNYAALLSLFYPFAFVALGWYKRWSASWWMLIGTILIMIVAIQFAYTRAAYLGLIIALGAWVVIKWKMTRHVLAGALLIGIVLINFLIQDNKYLDFAPNYDTTISHNDFNSLVEATYKLEDISTMERVYRWVAAFRMSRYELEFGYGPGNFYNFYRGYTVPKFKTYVSNNPERSGVHSYFLMMLVEQGIIGLVLFILLTFSFLIYGERIYHQTFNKERRQIILGIILSMIVIYSFLLINDLVETDKIGSFFFMYIAILVNFDLLNRKELTQ